MSNQADPAVAIEPRVVPLARINETEGHNPRSSHDRTELADLVDSIRGHSVPTHVLISAEKEQRLTGCWPVIVATALPARPD